MEAKARRARPAERLTLKDRLSRLTFHEAVKVLGADGKSLIQKNANRWDFKVAEDAYVGDDLFRLRFPEESENGGPLVVTITLKAEAKQRLHWNCTHCDSACAHVRRRALTHSRRQNAAWDWPLLRSRASRSRALQRTRWCDRRSLIVPSGLSSSLCRSSRAMSTGRGPITR